jgi:carbamoyltransferase
MITLGYSGFTRDSRADPGMRSLFAKTNQGFENLFAFREGEVPFPLFPLGFFGHDASAALLVDGRIVACAAEERFTRSKHSLNLAGNTLLPRNAIAYCLRFANLTIDDVDVVAHYCDFQESTIEERFRLLQPYLPDDRAALVKHAYQRVFRGMLSRESVITQFSRMEGSVPKSFMPVRHHEAHAASSFYLSGFPEAIVLTLDGTGELESSLLAVGSGLSIQELDRVLLPTSLGTIYLILTVFLGFHSLGDEYKVMGLAGYGAPERFRPFFDCLIRLEGEGRYSTPVLAADDFKELLIRELGQPRHPDAAIESRHADIAAALQEALLRAVLHTLRHARSVTGLDRLCLAGGVALNSSLNGAIARAGLFQDVFVQPAAGDEGCSVGAALHGYYRDAAQSRQRTGRWESVFLGPEYDNEEILTALRGHAQNLSWLAQENIAAEVATRLAQGQVAGWFQGRMEFGPRALGNRSILADPRDPGMKERINAKVKRREPFRPFAPSVLEEEAEAYFAMDGLASSPFMLFTVPVRDARRSTIPAVTHVDGTARIQTVSRATNPLFWELIAKFKALTGIPLVLNTSFNVRNEPIVCSPEDAIRCFLSTDIDCLAIGRFLVEKKAP